MRNHDGMRCVGILLGLFGTCGAWQVEYDLLGPVLEKTKSHIVQVGHEFDGWGLAVAPEWMEREYSLQTWAADEPHSDVQVDGAGVWGSVWMRPLGGGLKLGAYGRWRRFTFSFRNRPGWGSDDFRQSVDVRAAGIEGAWTWKPFGHLIVEPYARWGLAHHEMSWTGRAAEYPKNSEFRYEWDPDFRTGVLAGVEW